MKFFKDERAGALFMLLAACVGFALANQGGMSLQLQSVHGLIWPWLSQLAMALFFGLIGFELRSEFASGLFRNPKSILVPTAAAFVGVLVPAIGYLVVASSAGASSTIISGWPMVTATDVSFALMVFSLFAKSMPTAARAFLLSFAVIDDILASIALAIGFGRADALTPILSTSLAMTLAFSLKARHVVKVIKVLSPFVAFCVLPVFAFFAMQITLDLNSLVTSAGPLMVLLFIMRPFTKWFGVFIGAMIGNRLVDEPSRLSLRAADFLRISSLAGIGFTVSLLAADFAFGTESQLFGISATLTVGASLVAVLISAITLRARPIAK